MKALRVTYTSLDSYAATNAANIRKVMQELRQLAHPGIFYHVCLNADGKTFVHTAFFDTEGGEKTLLSLRSFQQFQEQLKNSSPEVGPRQEFLTLVGSSGEIFNH